MNLYALVGAGETGLAFALVALGAFLTFRVLDFPDLTVEGSFPLGAAVAAALMTQGVDCWTATAAAAAAGAAAGSVTAFLNQRLRVLHILAGILTSIALYSVSLRVMGRPNTPLLGLDTVYTPFEHLGVRPLFAPLICLALLVAVVTVLLDWFLLTGVGLAMRAAGANARMARANGVRCDRMVVGGLALANGLTGLSGALFAQLMGAADASMGVGVIVVALAAVIGGTALLPSRHIAVSTLACVLGSVLYRLAIGAALSMGELGVTASDVNIVTALLVTVALVLPGSRFRLMRRA